MQVNLFQRAQMRAWTGLLTSDGQRSDWEGKPVLNVEHVSLDDVLTRKYPFDAHFTTYHVVDASGQVDFVPRLKQESLPHLPEHGLQLRFGLFAFDVDDPVAHKTHEPASAEWRAGLDARVAALPADLRQGLGYYHGRGGARLLWRVEPMLSDPVEYMRLNHALRVELAKHGLEADDLKDWGRLYRAPHATRELADGTCEQLDYPKYLDGLGSLCWRPERLPDAHLASGGRVVVGAPGVTGTTRVPSEPGTYRVSKYDDEDEDTNPWDLINAQMPFELPDEIPEHGGPYNSRNITLFKLGCQLRGKGISLETIGKAVRAANKTRCKPPMEGSEIDAILSSVAQYPAGQSRSTPVPMLDPDFVKVYEASKVVLCQPAKAKVKQPTPPVMVQEAAPEDDDSEAPEGAPSGGTGILTGGTGILPGGTGGPDAPGGGTPAPLVSDAKRARLLATFAAMSSPPTATSSAASSAASSLVTTLVDIKSMSDAEFLENLPLLDDDDFRVHLLARVVQDPDIIYHENVLSHCGYILAKSQYNFNKLYRELTALKKTIPRLGKWASEVESTMRRDKIRNKVKKNEDASPEEKKPTFKAGTEVEVAYAALNQIRADGPDLAFDRGQLWRYSPVTGIWEPLGYGHLETIVYSYDQSPVLMDSGGKGEARFNLLRVTNHMASEAVTIVKKTLAQDKHGIGFFDEAQDGITFSDCFVRVDDDGQILTEEHSPEQRSTTKLNFEYVARDGRQPYPVKFIKTMAEWFQDDPDANEKMTLLQEMLGIFLIGRATKYQKGLILLGEGSNGKSTLRHVVETGLFGKDLVTHVTPQDMTSEYRLALLAKSRLNVVSDLPNKLIVNTDAVKSAISGDSMDGREIREAPFSFKPIAGQLYAANDLPKVADTSHGWWRRWEVITFNRKFTEAEQNTNLADEIIEEETAEIAAWLIEGAARVVKRHCYTQVRSSQVALAAWRTEFDTVAEFVEDKCDRVPLFDTRKVRIPKAGTPAAVVYSAYSQWCLEVGCQRVSSKELGKNIRRTAAVEFYKGKMAAYYGVTIRPPRVGGLTAEE